MLESSGALKEAINEITATAQARRRTRSVRDAEAYIYKIAPVDYRPAIRKHFDRRQLARIYADIRRNLPDLNRDTFRITDVGRLGTIAREHGVLLRAQEFRGPEGSGLRGFYINEAQVLKRPMIWINTATHPTATAASFWHEIGHHLTNQMWDTRPDQVSLRLRTTYGDDLSDPKEICADIVRALAGYPHHAARRLFGGPEAENINRDVDQLLARVLPYVGAEMGLNFGSSFSVRENLYLLGGVLHVAKLRAALLTEYSI